MKRNGKDRARDQTRQTDSDHERRGSDLERMDWDEKQAETARDSDERNDSDQEGMDWDETQEETARAGNQGEKTRIRGRKTRIRKKDFKSRRARTERKDPDKEKILKAFFKGF